MTLREIAAGEVTFHNVEELPELNDLDGLGNEQKPEEGEEAWEVQPWRETITKYSELTEIPGRLR